LPVSRWLSGGVLPRKLRLGIHALSLFTLGFALWFLTQSIYVINALCILCIFCFAGLLLVNWGLRIVMRRRKRVQRATVYRRRTLQANKGLLFANQTSWAESGAAQSTFEGYARQLSLDISRFKTDFASSETNGAIDASIKEFNERGLPKSTPTFLLNGKKISVRPTIKDFSKLIDAQLTRSDR
jgi:hypothetical protein